MEKNLSYIIVLKKYCSIVGFAEFMEIEWAFEKWNDVNKVRNIFLRGKFHSLESFSLFLLKYSEILEKLETDTQLNPK